MTANWKQWIHREKAGNISFLMTNIPASLPEKKKSTATSLSNNRTGENRFINRTRRYRCNHRKPRLQHQWVMFTATGSYILDPVTGKLRRFSRLNIKNGNVTRDNKGNAWVHNYTGNVWYVNTSTGDIKHFQFLSSEHLGYIDVERYSIIHDSRDIIWITTYGTDSCLRSEYRRSAALHF